MKKAKLLIMSLLTLSTLGIVSCNDNNTNNQDDDPNNNPYKPPIGGEVDKEKEAIEKLNKALNKDYSNLTLEWVSKYKVEDSIEIIEESGYSFYYKDYLVVFNEGMQLQGYENPYNYYKEVNDEFYMYFNGNVGAGEKEHAWLKKGYEDVSLNPNLSTFTLESVLNNLKIEDVKYYSSTNLYYVNEDKALELGNKIFEFAWNNYIDQIAFSLDKEGNIDHIMGFNMEDDDEVIDIKLYDYGTTTFNDSFLPPLPNEENIMEYWEYKGWPQKDMNIYIDEIEIEPIKYNKDNKISYINSRHLLGSHLLTKDNDKFKNGDEEISINEDKLIYKVNDISYELTKVEEVDDILIYRDGLNRHQLSIKLEGDNLTILTQYEASTSFEVEVEKTILLGASLLPLDVTKGDLIWKTSNPSILESYNNSDGVVVKPGLKEFIAHEVEEDTTVKVWAESKDFKEGSTFVKSNEIEIIIKANKRIDKENALYDIYFTNLEDSKDLSKTPFEVVETEEDLLTKYPEGVDTNYDYVIVKETNELFRYNLSSKEWISAGKYENTDLSTWCEVNSQNDVIEAYTGKGSLKETNYGDSKLFEGTDKVLYLDPFNYSEQTSGHSFPCFLELKLDKKITNISFEYGLGWLNDEQMINRLTDANIEYSKDGITFKSIDILNELKENLSSHTLRLMDKELVGGATIIRFNLDSGMVGGQGLRFGLQNIVLK